MMMFLWVDRFFFVDFEVLTGNLGWLKMGWWVGLLRVMLLWEYVIGMRIGDSNEKLERTSSHNYDGNPGINISKSGTPGTKSPKYQGITIYNILETILYFAGLLYGWTMKYCGRSVCRRNFQGWSSRSCVQKGTRPFLPAPIVVRSA